MLSPITRAPVVPYLCHVCVKTSVSDTIGGDNAIPDNVRNNKELAEFLVPQGLSENTPFGIKNPVLCQLS